MRGLIALVLFAGCASVQPATSVWLARTVTSGIQCSDAPSYPVPDARVDLRGVGVTAHEIVEREQAVCRACGCPETVTRQFVRVDAASADAARRLGFEPAGDGPE